MPLTHLLISALCMLVYICVIASMLLAFPVCFLCLSLLLSRIDPRRFQAGGGIGVHQTWVSLLFIGLLCVFYVGSVLYFLHACFSLLLDLFFQC